MNKGFTVIELVVAMLIVVIISAVAVSSYQDHVLRKERAEAKAVLKELAGWMDKNYTASGRYDLASDGVTRISNKSFNPGGLLEAYRQSPRDHAASKRYDISFAVIGARAYTLQADPVDSDSECENLQLNQLGAQTITGSGKVANCW